VSKTTFIFFANFAYEKKIIFIISNFIFYLNKFNGRGNFNNLQN